MQAQFIPDLNLFCTKKILWSWPVLFLNTRTAWRVCPRLKEPPPLWLALLTTRPPWKRWVWWEEKSPPSLNASRSRYDTLVPYWCWDVPLFYWLNQEAICTCHVRKAYFHHQRQFICHFQIHSEIFLLLNKICMQCIFIRRLSQCTVEARFSGHRFSGKPRFNGHSLGNLGNHFWFLVHKSARYSRISRFSGQKVGDRFFR